MLLARCSSIKLFEVTTANIAKIEDLVKHSTTIAAFRGTQKIRQFAFSNDVLEFRNLSCYECAEKCKHFHMGYYKSLKRCIENPKFIGLKTRNKCNDDGHPSNDIVCTNSNITYNTGDYVLIKWDENVYPGEIISVSQEGALVRCMKRGTKSWKWPKIRDEQLQVYAWHDILRKIEPPKLINILQDKVENLIKGVYELFSEARTKLISKVEENAEQAVRQTIPSYASIVKKDVSVIIKPKNINQSHSETRNIVRQNVNPVDNDIKFSQVKNVKNGGLVIRCDGPDDASKLKELASQSLSEEYKIKERTPYTAKKQSLSSFSASIISKIKRKKKLWKKFKRSGDPRDYEEFSDLRRIIKINTDAAYQSYTANVEHSELEVSSEQLQFANEYQAQVGQPRKMNSIKNRKF
nr:unnamed protein product [Callosobruchus chinensis]